MKITLMIFLALTAASCRDGNTADDEKGHHSTYSLANSDSVSGNSDAAKDSFTDMGTQPAKGDSQSDRKSN